MRYLVSADGFFVEGNATVHDTLLGRFRMTTATTTTSHGPRRGERRPRLSEVMVITAPFLWGLVVTLLLPLLPPFPQPSLFLENMLGQSVFALAPLAVALSGRLSWGSIGLSRANLAPSLALGALYVVIVVAIEQALVLLGLMGTGTMIGGEPSRVLGVPLAFLLYLTFWGLLESVWMCYLIYAANRWLTGGGALGWRALLLAALWFGLMHAFTQVVAFGAPPTQALLSLPIGLALLIPGTIPKLTGNAWGLVLWFTVSNFGTPALLG